MKKCIYCGKLSKAEFCSKECEKEDDALSDAKWYDFEDRINNMSEEEKAEIIK